MQLNGFLKRGGNKKVNVIAINWSEERYKNSSNNPLHNLVKTFHPLIRVVYSNKKIEKYFNHLTAVPMSFIFNKNGKTIYGNGDQSFLGAEKLMQILNSNIN